MDDRLSFYLQDYYVKEWVENSMLFLEVEIISKSTEGRDRGVKYESYQAHGVTEYWIVDPKRETVEQYLRKTEGKIDRGFQLVEKLVSGDTVNCPTLRDFAVPIQAIFDEEENLSFVARLLDD